MLDSSSMSRAGDEGKELEPGHQNAELAEGKTQNTIPKVGLRSGIVVEQGENGHNKRKQ